LVPVGITLLAIGAAQEENFGIRQNHSMYLWQLQTLRSYLPIAKDNPLVAG
jgi:hypothetical protein